MTSNNTNEFAELTKNFIADQQNIDKAEFD